MIDDRQHVRQLGIAVSGMEETDIVDDDDVPETRRGEQMGQFGQDRGDRLALRRPVGIAMDGIA